MDFSAIAEKLNLPLAEVVQQYARRMKLLNL
jgi:hypothetical protein